MELAENIPILLLLLLVVYDCNRGPQRGKRDGVIQHILERENGNWMNKLRYCMND